MTSLVFDLQTDASSIGVGAILEQGGRVIRRALNQAEKQYSVIQKECLAIVFALKQFRHYLLGRSFELLTDHAPLQWEDGGLALLMGIGHARVRFCH